MLRQIIKIEERTIFGKKVKKLRKDGLLPVNIYGKDIKSTAAQLQLKAFKDLFRKVHETGLVDVELDKKTLPALIHNVQIDPRTREIIHADFYKVDLKEKIKANIPVISVGEAPAQVDKKGLLLQVLSELEIEALPTDLPEKIEVNVEGLKELDEEIPVSAIKAPAGVTILNEPSQIVFKIEELVAKETEKQAAAEEAAAAEAKAEGEAAETTAPAQPEEEQQPQAPAEVKKE